jgi:hypothetical protein
MPLSHYDANVCRHITGVRWITNQRSPARACPKAPHALERAERGIAADRPRNAFSAPAGGLGGGLLAWEEGGAPGHAPPGWIEAQEGLEALVLDATRAAKGLP